MTTPILGSTSARVAAGLTRSRQTLRPRNRFTEVLRSGADMLLAGAGAASGLVGGPLLSAAVGAARAGLGRLGGASGGATQGLTTSTSSTTSSGTSSSGNTEIDAMRQLQQEGQQASLQYLKLQQEMQAENRRFSLASSVLKAKHDTARSVLNNLRV